MPAKRRKGPVAQKPDTAPGAPRDIGRPLFAQPEPTADPTQFRIRHASDGQAYKTIDELNREHKIHPLPFPPPRGGVEPQLTLTQVLGGAAPASTITGGITRCGQIVFHATGDCGSTRGPKTQNEVTDKMISDFHDEADPSQLPQFAFLLGDIVYSFGETQYYYDQFYEPYRDYAAPILAVAGNHDGMIAPELHARSLDAFLRNFCSDGFVITPEAGGLTRTAQIQPGVFYTFDAPFVRILAFYSNMLEDPGVIADDNIGKSQLDFLRTALSRIKKERYPGAVLFAHHHPPYTASHSASRHGWSVQMLADMDKICSDAGVWPHAVLAGHVHNYQRFTRTRPDGTEIPYVSCGNGGHNVQSLRGKGSASLRVPQILQKAARGTDQVVFENYDDRNYGYLRIIVTPAQLRIEYHAASDAAGSKSPDDSVTVNLATRKLEHFAAPDLGRAQEKADVRKEAAASRRRGRR